MSTSDKEIVAMLAEKLGITPKEIVYDDVGNLISLDLSRRGLSQVPVELGQLRALEY